MTASQHEGDGAFARHAFEFFEHGFAVLPTGGEDGKRPLTRGFHKAVLGPDAIDKLAKQHPDANLGFVPTMSKIGGGTLAILDVDTTDRAIQRRMIERFGDTPIKVRTGSGNMQAYYRTPKRISSRNLRQSEGEPVELKCDGTICVAPPSVNPKTGGAYAFLEGDLRHLSRLPEIDLSSLAIPDVRTSAGMEIDIGLRNLTLFRQCLREARHCDDIQTLIDCARSFAEDYFVEPMSRSEIDKTAASAWGYQLAGKNWVGREAHVVTPKSLIKRLAAGIPSRYSGDAFMLLSLLRAEHAARQARGEPFRLVCAAMERDQVLEGWTRKQYMTAVGWLLDAGYLECISKRSGRPSLYCLSLKAIEPEVAASVREPVRWLT